METTDPDLRVSRLAKPVAELAQRVRSLDSTFRPLLGKWEADIEAFHLLLLAAVHALSAARLAHISPSLHPSACVLARSCMESGARALWLIHPEEPFAREARWLAHLESDASSCERLAKYFSTSATGPSLERAARAIREFGSGVAALLPPDISPPARIPKVLAMLETIGCPEKYLLYIQLSQTTP